MIVAIVLTGVLTLLALAVDGGRLYIERNQLDRAAQSASDAGIGWVGEQMVTLSVSRQTEAAVRPACLPDGAFGDVGASCTATPQPNEISHWLNDDDRATLVGPEIQQTAEAVAREYAARNGVNSSSRASEDMEFVYPYAYDPKAPTLAFRTTLRRQVTVLLVGLLATRFAHVQGVGQAEITQR